MLVDFHNYPTRLKTRLKPGEIVQIDEIDPIDEIVQTDGIDLIDG